MAGGATAGACRAAAAARLARRVQSPFSLWILLTALARILRGRIEGRLAGVHVNMGERLSFVRKGLIVIACRALGVPVVLHLHAQMKTFYEALPAPLQRLTRWVFSLPECVLVIGPQARRFVTEELQVPPERVEIVINGVPEPAQQRRNAPHPAPCNASCSWAGCRSQGRRRPARGAGPPGLRSRRLEVTVAGGGDVAAYQARGSRAGHRRTSCAFPAGATRTRSRALLAQTDVLVLPSYDEVLPLVILEALANGVAVVCTAVGEIPSLLTDGVDVVYVSPGDADGIAGALQRVLGQPELLERLERNGRALYERQFSMGRFFVRVAHVHQRTFGIAGHPLEPVTRHNGAPAVILDANTIPNGACLRPDVCVVGGGPAGIALALSLSGQGLRVLLLEAGNEREHGPTQSLYDGEVADERLHSPPDKYRQRRMGGSTTTWGGRCMPFDAIDFEARSQVPGSGWPISLEDLLPFYPQANALAEAGRFSYDARDALGETALPMIRGFDSPLVRTNGLERFSCPTDFGRRYARRLRVAPDIEVLMGANCTGIRLQPTGARCANWKWRRWPARALASRHAPRVLAIGGLETARLLLASRDVAPAGVGNEHDVVGRYYMCHIAGNVGTLVVNGSAAERAPRLRGDA